MHDMRTMYEKFDKALDTAKDVYDVLAILESLSNREARDLYTRNAFDFLPTFGGPRIKNSRVYSYDVHHVLVIVSESGSPRRFAIIGRHELDTFDK